MRFSWLLGLVLIAGCSKQSTAPFRRLAILPIENLSSDAAKAVDTGALRWAIWDSLQAQPALHTVLASHPRELPELGAALVIEGYAADGRFQLQLNGEPLACAGTLADCVPVLVKDIAGRLAVTPRPLPRTASLQALAAIGAADQAIGGLEAAVKSDPSYSSLWLGWAGAAQARGGPQAAMAILSQAPSKAMPPFDAARVQLRLAELKQDREARSQALVALARVSPADIELQAQAAQEAANVRDFDNGARIFDQLLALAPAPRFYNQAAYIAAFLGDRAKAEKYAAAAQAAAPSDPAFLDTRGEIAFYFGDFAAAAGYFEQAAALNITFLNGLDLWKAADAARRAGDASRAKAALNRYLELRTKSGQRNTLVLEAVWEWLGENPEAASQKLHAAADSMERGKALFLSSLMALNRRNFPEAQVYRRQLDPNSIEAAFLGSVMDGAPLPPGLPFPPEAIAALHHHLRGNAAAAKEAFAAAKKKIDPFGEGQWRKFEAELNGSKPAGLLPASPDDWLAVLLR